MRPNNTTIHKHERKPCTTGFQINTVYRQQYTNLLEVGCKPVQVLQEKENKYIHITFTFMQILCILEETCTCT